METDKIEYPIIIEIPENYWTFSHSVEYSYKENTDD